jgi:flavodoxin
MKVLIAYLSQTGNTAKVAQAILEEASKNHEAELKTMEGVSPGALAAYQAVFVGSPIHAGGLAAAAKGFLESLPEAAGFTLAGFVTHSSSAYESASFEKGLAFFQEICQAKKIAFAGAFDCQGRLAKAIQPMVQKARKLSDEEWAQRMAQSDPHPSAEDEEKAKAFARKVLG